MPAPAPAKKKSGRRFDSPQQQAYLNLWRTYDRLCAAEDALFGRYDLTAQQYNALAYCAASIPARCRRWCWPSGWCLRGRISRRMIDRLEQRKLVERIRSEANRRVVHLRITAAGLALLAELDEPVRQCHQKQLGHMNAVQLRSLVELLQAVRGPHEPDGSSWK